MIWSYLQRFSQPSEVAGPIELIRDSAVFHARGLINSRAIPQNSDWIWPYWVHRQFNPSDNAFLPKAFSLTYINLTERNWTAVGQPNCGYLPIVDGAGLVTPHWDGWSLDFWLINQDGQIDAAARGTGRTLQRLCYLDNLAVVTKCRFDSDTLTTVATVDYENGSPYCRIRVRCRSRSHGRLAVSLRPYNPEGISFLHTVEVNIDRNAWRINDKDRVCFDCPIETHRMQSYAGGDVANHLQEEAEPTEISCDVGMATAAALFSLEGSDQFDLNVSIPLDTHKLHASKHSPGNKTFAHSSEGPYRTWQDSMKDSCKIDIPDKELQALYERALRNVVLHTIGEDVYPGPFTYKRFWFRDASFILNALLCGNLSRLAHPVLNSYPERQKSNGYFQSQYGEWDSNGQAIWILYRYWKMTGGSLESGWLQAVGKAADWLCEHCLDPNLNAVHAGLLPAGFSAEHFGPNDYYYWDDFWAVAGLECAAAMFHSAGNNTTAERYETRAKRLRDSIDGSLEQVAERIKSPAIPVSPYRRMDSGAVGSIVCGYPLQVFAARDERLLATANFLMDSCRFKEGFFLDISHSGINPYLTLHIAQVLLRAGDLRHFELAHTLSRLASPTGQWPEAIHPRTEGGCMGDGQHIWAAAEWVNYLRNFLVYEEEKDNTLVLGAGIEPSWISPDTRLSIGPGPTLWGTVNATFDCQQDSVHVRYDADWHAAAPALSVRIPGYEETPIPEGQTDVVVNPKA